MKKLFFVTALFNCSQLLSQDSIRTMDEVTLTATKFSIKTTETGKLVTIISKQDIEHAGSRDLAQVITELGGVFINGFNSNPGKEKNIYLLPIKQIGGNYSLVSDIKWRLWFFYIDCFVPDT